MRNSQEVQTEIKERFGFFSPFFSPALETPEILESLWQQTLSADINNPLPAVFKESLFTYLSQYCSVPYSIICHSCALRSLGRSSKEILELLETPIAENKKTFLVLSEERKALKNWPIPDSKLWKALFASSVRIFLRPARSHRHRKELRRLLGPQSYAYLTAFLSYIKTSHNWLEANPEVSYETDQRAQENLAALLVESPKLEEFFKAYSDRIGRERVGAAKNRALQREAGKFQVLVETTQEGVVLADANGKISFCNGVGTRMFGYATEELNGQPITLLIPQVLHDALGKTTEFIGRRKSGEKFPVELSLSSWRQEGRNAFAGILRDLSDRKRSELVDRQNQDILRQKLQELEQRKSEVALLSEMTRVLQAVLSVQEAYEIVGRFAPKLFPHVSGAFYILNGSKVLLESVTNWGQDFVGGPNFGPTDCWALRTGRVHSIQNFRSDPLCQHLGQDWKAQALCIPLAAQGEILGVLSLQAPENLLDGQQHLGAAFAESIALALANLRLRDALRAQAIRDPLTELFNRRYMEESLLRELARADRKSTSLGIAMLDIDHFKAFNDTHGHAAGDRLLQSLGVSLQKHMRKEDIACRYGGEEFLLMLVDASVKDSLELAEGLSNVVKRLRVFHRGKTLPPVTISIGISGFPDHGSTAEELIQAADSALYLAKDEGRNRVNVAPEKPRLPATSPRVRIEERP